MPSSPHTSQEAAPSSDCELSACKRYLGQVTCPQGLHTHLHSRDLPRCTVCSATLKSKHPPASPSHAAKLDFFHCPSTPDSAFLEPPHSQDMLDSAATPLQDPASHQARSTVQQCLFRAALTALREAGSSQPHSVPGGMQQRIHSCSVFGTSQAGGTAPWRHPPQSRAMLAAEAAPMSWCTPVCRHRTAASSPWMSSISRGRTPWGGPPPARSLTALEGCAHLGNPANPALAPLNQSSQGEARMRHVVLICTDHVFTRPALLHLAFRKAERKNHSGPTQRSLTHSLQRCSLCVAKQICSFC